MTSTATPPPTICPTLLCQDAQALIKQLTEAFGFTPGTVYQGKDGTVGQAELSHGNGTVMLSSREHRGRGGMAEALKSTGPAVLYVVVDDADAHFERAQHSGADILMPLTERYGAKSYTARDTEGNIWTFGTYRPGTQESA